MFVEVVKQLVPSSVLWCPQRHSPVQLITIFICVLHSNVGKIVIVYPFFIFFFTEFNEHVMQDYSHIKQLQDSSYGSLILIDEQPYRTKPRKSSLQNSNAVFRYNTYLRKPGIKKFVICLQGTVCCLLYAETIIQSFSNAESPTTYCISEKYALGFVLSSVFLQTLLSWADPGNPAR